MIPRDGASTELRTRHGRRCFPCPADRNVGNPFHGLQSDKERGSLYAIEKENIANVKGGNAIIAVTPFHFPNRIVHILRPITPVTRRGRVGILRCRGRRDGLEILKRTESFRNYFHCLRFKF